MGRLIGLEVKNFKSYKGVHNVGFGGKNFISIVGPNGSGKSNMMDAISFVLGIRSSHLRSSALVDLIYRGRMEEGGSAHENNPKSAYVTAFYVKQDASGAERRMEFTRVIHNTGDSTYKLDGKTVGYKEYVDVLEGERILVKARNFLVFQGDVEQIASQSGVDLTKLFEQVSGSVQYQREYERLKDDYEKASAEYNESLKARRKMQIDLKSFKEGVQKEEQYISLLAERVKLQQQFMLWQLFHLQSKRSGLVASLKDSKAKLSQLKRQLSNEEAILGKSKSLVAKEELLLARRRETLLQKQQDKARLNAQLLPVGSARQGTTRRMVNIEKRIDSLQRDIERQESYVKQLKNQLKVVGKTKASFEAELEKSASGKFTLSEEQKKEYEELKEVYLSSGGSEFEEKLAILQNKKEELSEEIAVFEKRIGISKTRAEHDLKVDIERLEVEVSERTGNLNDKNAIHSEKVREWKQIQSEIESANNKEYELSYKLREVLAKLDDLSANQRETNKERKLRENVATLRRLFPGVRGLVHDLCRPKKEKYAVGVSTILGKNFDSVIVDSLSVAQQCISYLKKHRSGVASFIPLDTIDTSSPTLPAGDNTGCILTLDAIEYESSLEKAMQYVCSDSIICDSLDIARNLKWNRNVKSKLVTLEGALIHRAGLMTGGITKNNTNRWDKEEYQSLLLLKDKISTELSELTTGIRTGSIKSRDYENEVSLLSTEISSLRSQLNQLNRSMKEALTELNYHDDLIEKEYSPKVDSLHKMVEEVDGQMADIAKDKANLQASVYKDFSKKIGFDIGEYEQHTGGRLRKHSRELQQLQKEVMNIENKLEFETERLESTIKRQQKAREDLKKVQGELDSLTSQETDIQSNLEQVTNQIAEETKVLEEAQEKLKKKGNNIKIIEDTINDLHDSIQTCKREITEWKEDIEKVGIERVNILKNCKMTNIELPLDSSALEDLAIERIDAETIEAGNNISVDYSRLSARYKESSSHHIRDEFESSIKAIDNTLTELQPNSKAVERFDEARDQFNAVSGESDKLKESERKAKELYLKIKEKRINTFLACFNHVRDNIDRIYRELTRNPGSTAELAGGSASLTLEDEDEPYLGGIRYHATPPMKRFKDMDYLSGGEKTMAALALLFAINSYQPSPFFILDEVDAALDVTNVERIAAYIRRHASPKMQFIVISLKSNLFSKSESMAGVFRNQHENSSMVITTDLTQYADDM